ncbi:hypothetical protein KAX97_02835 [candidate division WOR-3 bacterium]|nr:hypothetical protein [candidate division WOR-3 bacterium]MCK4453253.1 hypothetical protein [candidate division WOR-3 bacterium]
MKKMIGFLIILIFLSCDTGIEINLDCMLKHTAGVIKLESDLLGEREDVLVNLLWTWTLGTPDGEGIIVQRSIGDSTHFTTLDTLSPIADTMYYNDSDTILSANTLVYYRLGFLNDNSVDYFITTDISIPSSQHFYEPADDTLGGDTLHITFAQLADFDACSISVYQAFTTEPESLINLTNSLFDTALSYPDTNISIYMPESTFPDTILYTIKLSSSKILTLITDTSIGFRAFFKFELP